MSVIERILKDCRITSFTMKFELAKAADSPSWWPEAFELTTGPGELTCEMVLEFPQETVVSPVHISPASARRVIRVSVAPYLSPATESSIVLQQLPAQEQHGPDQR